MNRVHSKRNLFLLFFLLGKKEPKSQGERPTPIFYRTKSLRNAA
jgi:hypothetical protein